MKLLILLTLLVVLQLANGAKKRVTTKSPQQMRKLENQIRERVKNLGKVEFKNIQVAAAKKMEGNLVVTLKRLAKGNKAVPKKIQNYAKVVLVAINDGTLADASQKVIPNVIGFPINQQPGVGQTQPSNIQNQGQQFGNVFQNLGNLGPGNLGGPLQGIGDFLKTSLNGANNSVTKLLNGVPNALQGVVQVVVGNLGIAGDTLGTTVDSLGPVLGGLLGGVGVG